MRGNVAAAVNAVKPIDARRRPFLADAGPVCQPRAALANSFGYPSGQSSWGTAVALILAELIPARADPILACGSDWGDSRIICGAHNASAVAAGRQVAGAFRTDMEAVRTELDRAAAVMRRTPDSDVQPIVLVAVCP